VGVEIVSELVATRIGEHAERLWLSHLAESQDSLVDRAEQQTTPASSLRTPH
jgi:hypothetical protein